MDETFSNSLRLQTRLIGSIFDVSPENMLNVIRDHNRSSGN